MDLPSPEAAIPRLAAYGQTVADAYRAYHQSRNADYFERLTDAILCDLGQLPAGESRVRGDWHLQKDLGMDSIALAEAAFIMEDLFAVRLDNATLQEIQTVTDLRQALAHHVQLVEPMGRADSSS